MDIPIYTKTEQGQAEIQARTLALRLRRVLIMVDGQRDARALALLSATPDIDAALAELLAQGFIQVSEVRQSTPPKAPAPAATGPSLGYLQREAARALTELLGPSGDDLAIRIEKTKTVTDWASAVAAAADVVGIMLNAEAAQRFSQRMAALMPPSQPTSS